jgi:GDP-L-fucose synthase
MKVLVTGGSGFIGSRLQKSHPDWVYVSSKNFDLTKQHDAFLMFYEIKPDAVIHLAGKVGGIKDNLEKQEEYFFLNTIINTNVIRAAIKTGTPRLLASMSTCAFPDELKSYPFSEEELFCGPPAKTNFSYGFSKRMLHVHCMSCRKQYGLNYSTFCPTNVYGPGDTFDSEASHFVPALISKLHKAKSGEVIDLWGTGKPLRQQLYIDDLVEIVPLLLEKHNSNVPLIVAPNENLSISEMANILLHKLNKDNQIRYNIKLEGQYRKDGSNKRLKNIIGEFDFTKFEDGVYKTYEWYSNK